MMRTCLLVAIGLVAVASANPQSTSRFLYSVSSGNNTTSAFNIDAGSGALTPIAGSPFATADSPFVAAVDPSGRFLYIGEHSTKEAHVEAFRIDPKTGALSTVPGSPFNVALSPAALAVDETGRFLYVGGSANNGIAAYSLDAHLGALTPADPPMRAQSDSQLLAHPTAPYLFAVGGRTLGVYRIDPGNGALTEVGGSSSARNVAVSQGGAFLYGRLSKATSVFAFDATTGALTMVPGSPFRPVGDGAIALHPTGRFLYAVISSSEAVSGFLIDSATGGLLASVPGSPFATGNDPSQLAADRSGRFLYVGNSSGSISGYSIDGSSGTLTALQGSPFVAGSGIVGLLAVTPSTATPPTLVGLQVTPPSASVVSSSFGQTVQFTCVGQYSDGSTRFLTATARWSSSDTGIATVSNSPHRAGLATTKGVGVATIRAAIGRLTASAEITVSQPRLVSIVVTPANPTVTVGTTIQFTATATYNDGSKRNITRTATWASSSEAIASVSAGLAKALAPGGTTISASVGTVAGSTSLAVQ